MGTPYLDRNGRRRFSLHDVYLWHLFVLLLSSAHRRQHGVGLCLPYACEVFESQPLNSFSYQELTGSGPKVRCQVISFRGRKFSGHAHNKIKAAKFAFPVEILYLPSSELPLCHPSKNPASNRTVIANLYHGIHRSPLLFQCPPRHETQ